MWESVFAWLAVGAGVIAAGLWLVASLVKLPPMVPIDASLEERFPFDPVRHALDRAAAWNAWAAGATAGAALLQALSLVAHRLGV